MILSGSNSIPKGAKVGWGVQNLILFFVESTNINTVHRQLYSIFVVLDFMEGAIREKTSKKVIMKKGRETLL